MSGIRKYAVISVSIFSLFSVVSAIDGASSAAANNSGANVDNAGNSDGAAAGNNPVNGVNTSGYEGGYQQNVYRPDGYPQGQPTPTVTVNGMQQPQLQAQSPQPQEVQPLPPQTSVQVPVQTVAEPVQQQLPVSEGNVPQQSSALEPVPGPINVPTTGEVPQTYEQPRYEQPMEGGYAHDQQPQQYQAPQPQPYQEVAPIQQPQGYQSVPQSELPIYTEDHELARTHGVRLGNAANAPMSAVSPETPVDAGEVNIDCESPSYNKLIPIAGWNRYSGDSASTLKEWNRWWQYLRMKTPVVMKWLDDLVVRIYPGNEIYRAIFVKGIYDPNSIVVVNSFLPTGGVFIDVGASFGHFALPAAKQVGPNGRIIAIEPSSRDYNRLIDNVKINNLWNVISSYRLAISNATGTAILNVATEERSALNTLGSEFSFKGVDRVAREEVDTISLDDFVVANQIKRVDVIKLDIEGSELKALQGARDVIAKSHPMIMLGVNSNALRASGTDHDEIQKILNELNYKAYKIVEEPVFALQEIPDLTKEPAKIVFCLPANVTPPALPQPAPCSVVSCIGDFFTR